MANVSGTIIYWLKLTKYANVCKYSNWYKWSEIVSWTARILCL